jgi:transposase
MASDYSNKLYKDYENEINKNIELEKLNETLSLRLSIAESKQQRLKKTVNEKKQIINEQNKQIEACKQEIINLKKQLDIAVYEKNNYLSKLNNDSANSGLPTSQTPINKKKRIPNSREKTGNKIGGQPGHKKNKLQKFNQEEANEHVEYTLDECPCCGSKDLEMLDSETIKQVSDYKIKILKVEHHFKEYKCHNCNKVVKKNIPNHLKEDIQYGSNVQATALTLLDIGNVPINKVKRIIDGLTMNEINLSEGFISKLQQRAASKLDAFIKDAKFYITHLKLIHWDDTTIMVNKKRSCIRFYGNEDVALYFAHLRKDKEGIDEDNILKLVSSLAVLIHDHNLVNYNKDYSFINAECCQHLIRDLQKVTDNIPNRTWASKIKELFQEYNHKRNELIKQNIDHFSDDEFNNLLLRLNEYLLLGVDENLADSKVYYADDEQTLLLRIMEYRDNYIYWTLDFDLPFTNNLSERSLRGIKSKMKVSGQFQNIKSAEYYATIRSYIETCHRNGVNEYDCLNRLIQGNPYSLEEILEIGKNRAEKSK